MDSRKAEEQSGIYHKVLLSGVSLLCNQVYRQTPNTISRANKSEMKQAQKGIHYPNSVETTKEKKKMKPDHKLFLDRRVPQ